MKEVGKLWRITRRFYLMILGIVLIMAIWNSAYLCNYEKIAFTGKSVETTITEKLAIQSANIGIMPADLTHIADLQREDMTIKGWALTFVGIVAMLFIRYFAYMDAGTREFLTIWPISKRKRVLFDYVTMLSILIVGWATEMVIYLVAGNHYNKVAERILTEYSMDTSAFSDAALLAENKTFLLLMVLYLLFEIIFYTFLFLGMTLAKNPILGFPVCFIVYGTASLLLDKIIMGLWENQVIGNISVYVSNKSALLVFFEGLYGLICQDEMFYNQIEIYGLEGRTAYEEYMSQVDVMGAGTGITILLLFELIMIGLIIWISKRKELSDGRILFSEGADISIGICFLVFMYLLLTLVFSEFAALIGIGFVGIIAFVLIRKRGTGMGKNSDSVKWEVK